MLIHEVSVEMSRRYCSDEFFALLGPHRMFLEPGYLDTPKAHEGDDGTRLLEGRQSA